MLFERSIDVKMVRILTSTISKPLFITVTESLLDPTISPMYSGLDLFAPRMSVLIALQILKYADGKLPLKLLKERSTIRSFAKLKDL